MTAQAGSRRSGAGKATASRSTSRATTQTKGSVTRRTAGSKAANKPTAKKPTGIRATRKSASPKSAGRDKPIAAKPAGRKPTTVAKRGARKPSNGESARRRSSSTRPRLRAPHRLLLVGFLVSVAVVAFLLLGVFPTRTYLAQRSATAKAEGQLDNLDARNAVLEKRITRLETPAEIERIARKEYGLAKPGEEVYAVLPAPPPPVELPDVWPFTGLAKSLNR